MNLNRSIQFNQAKFKLIILEQKKSQRKGIQPRLRIKFKLIITKKRNPIKTKNSQGTLHPKTKITYYS